MTTNIISTPEGLSNGRKDPGQSFNLEGLWDFLGTISNPFKKAAEAQKKAEQIVDTQISDLGSWYKKESGTSYLDTEAVQSALGQLRTSLAQTLQTQGNQLRSGGGTAEAALAGRTQAAENYSNTVGKLVGYQTDRKDQLMRDYQYRLQHWKNAQLGLQQQQAGNWSQIGSDMIALPFEIISSLVPFLV